MAGNDVDLFGDWMVRRNSRQLTSSPSLAEMRKVRKDDYSTLLYCVWGAYFLCYSGKLGSSQRVCTFSKHFLWMFSVIYSDFGASLKASIDKR